MLLVANLVLLLMRIQEAYQEIRQAHQDVWPSYLGEAAAAHDHFRAASFRRRVAARAVVVAGIRPADQTLQQPARIHS